MNQSLDFLENFDTCFLVLKNLSQIEVCSFAKIFFHTVLFVDKIATNKKSRLTNKIIQKCKPWLFETKSDFWMKATYCIGFQQVPLFK